MKKIKIILLLIVSLMLSACVDSYDKIKYDEINKNELVNLSPVNGGEVVLPLTGTNSLNPLLTNNENYFQFSKLIYDSLFVVDKLGNIVHSIAEHYEISADGLTVSVTLKDGVKWHDGEALTSEDVANTYNALKYLPPESAYYKLLRGAIGISNSFNIENFSRAVVFDERNLDFQFDRPYSNVLEILTFPILPSHIYEGEGFVANEDFKVIGTGPFKFSKEDKLQEITLEKNVNYHGRAPYVDFIRGKVLESSDMQINAFETAQIDMTVSKAFDWNKYLSNSRIKLEEFNTNSLETIVFNTKAPIFQEESGRNLRRAIAHGVNKERIINSLYLGKADITSFFFNPKFVIGNQVENSIYYNVETAKKILIDAGFKDLDGDSFFETPQGEKFSLGIKTNSYNYLRKTMADLIADDLKTIGVNAHVDYEEINPDAIYDKTSLNEQWTRFTETLNSSDFQVAIIGIDFSIIPDVSTVLHSNGIGRGLNYSRYSKVEMDALINKLTVGVHTEEEKIELYNQINNLFLEECPYVPLFFKKNALLVDNKIKNNIDPTFFNNYRGLKDVYIPKEFR